MGVVTHGCRKLSILHGLQLWIALPDQVRHMPPNFFHYPTIPLIVQNGLHINLLVGTFLDTLSPVKVYSPLVGIELNAIEDTTSILPLDPTFEYAPFCH